MGPDADFDATIAAARAGDEAAITRLYRDHQPRLLRVLRAEAGDAADDIASQTWLEVVGALGRFAGDERGFRAFLFTVARRRLADLRRSRRRRPSTAVEPAALAETVDVATDVEGDALAGLGAEEATELVVRILGPDQAEVVLLRVVAGLSVDEVAAILDRAPGTIRVQQHRALKRLAAALGGQAGTTGGNERPVAGDREG